MPDGTKSEQFDLLRSQKPEPGTILSSKEGGFVKVYVDTSKTSKSGDCQQVMFVNVEIDYDCTGWYLTSKNLGLKALILARSQDVLMSSYENFDSILIDKLRVVRHNKAGTALICEVLG
jgi:hypothetical protein